MTFGKPDNVNVHRAAAKTIVSKSRAARGSVLLSGVCPFVLGLANSMATVSIRLEHSPMFNTVNCIRYLRKDIKPSAIRERKRKPTDVIAVYAPHSNRRFDKQFVQFVGDVVKIAVATFVPIISLAIRKKVQVANSQDDLCVTNEPPRGLDVNGPIANRLFAISLSLINI